jgi:hypothetical protein
MAKKVFWKTKDGKRIDVDTMSKEHLKNSLKMLIRKTEKKRKSNRVQDFFHYDEEETYTDHLRQKD